MKCISVKEAKPGMILARPITDQQGRTIVNEGASLSQVYISRLGKWGVDQLYIQEEEGAERGDVGLAQDQGMIDEIGATDDAAGEDIPDMPTRLGLPPGVKRGDDLLERIDRTFAGTEGDVLLSALHRAVRKRYGG